MSAAVDATHDPSLRSWVESANRTGHDFPVQNLPLGVFAPRGGALRAGVAIGDFIFDLPAAAEAGLLSAGAFDAARLAAAPSLNALVALGTAARVELRRQLSVLLSEPAQRTRVEAVLHRASDCTMALPMAIGDYTDFYVGIHHATNVGRLFRPDNPLLPNYKHVPIGYHGRASSVRVSGTALRRPSGQRKAPDAGQPSFGPAQRLDYELELGLWIGRGNALGEPIPITEAGDHIAGLSLLNDWSARDVQAWEYQPLGPFLAKNFLTSVSPWLVSLEALAPFRIAQAPRPEGDPRPLPYLWSEADQASGAFAIDLEVALLTPAMRERGMTPQRISHAEACAMYWTAAQMVAHHTSNGCDLHVGDLLGTGTISSANPEGYGSLLELTRGGADPVRLESGETRAFLLDGDEVVMRGCARAEGYVPIGFGECRGVVVTAM